MTPEEKFRQFWLSTIWTLIAILLVLVYALEKRAQLRQNRMALANLGMSLSHRLTVVDGQVHINRGLGSGDSGFSFSPPTSDED